jgi:rhamnosyltransferase subunit B
MQNHRLLLMPFGSHGDVHPFIGLGLALRTRGYDVTIIVNGYFRELVERVGLNYVEQGTKEEFLSVANNPDLWHPFRGFPHLVRNGIAKVMRDQFDFIENQSRESKVVVLSNCLGFGARIASEKLYVPLITVHLQPAVILSAYETPAFPGMLNASWVPHWLKRAQFRLAELLVIDRASLPVISPFRKELGLAPVKNVTKWFHSPDCVLCLFPEWYAPKQPDWPMNSHLTDFPFWDESSLGPLDSELMQFLDSGSKPIVFTAGTGNMLAPDFFRESAEACRLLGQRGLLLTKFTEQIPLSLNKDVMHVPYAPFSQLLKHCSAIVHHGGIGTTSQALRAGTPQLIVPMAHDQPDNANRVKKLGVGDSLSPKSYNANTASAKLDALIHSDATKAACAKIASRWSGAEQPFDDACRVIGELIANK